MKRITFFLASILCLAACSHEVVENPMDGPNIPEDRPQIELRMPDAEKVNVYSAASLSECLIDSVWVLVFDSNTKNLKAAEHIGGDKIFHNGQATQLMPQLSVDIELGDSVVCIANADPNPDTTKLNLKLNTINSCFKLENNNYYHGGDGEYLPMYGSMEWRSDNYTCEMVRAVAKIQIQMGKTVTDATGNFTAENVSYKIYCAGDNGYIQPTPGVITGIPQPSLGYGSEEHFLIQKENAGNQDTHVYLYEYPSSNRTGIDINTPIDNKTFHRNRQHIILTKDNSALGQADTHYRLDFYNAADSTFLDTKRNHHYIFTINRIRSEGYTNQDDAIRNPGSNIIYSILIKDDANSIASNGQYAIVTGTDSVKLYTAPGSQTATTVRYDDPSGALNATVNSITVESSPAGAITLNSPTTITSTNVEVKLTINTAPSTGTILFKLGNITHKVHVTGIPVI